MNNFTHNFVWIILVAGIGALGYWGWFGLSESTSISYVGQIETEVADQDITPEIPEMAFIPEEAVVPEPEPVNEEKEIPTQYSALAAQLQVLVDKGIQMKVGSVGTRVGSVQKFLNVYEGKDSRADNDYGNGTKARVASFQKAEGLDADGLAGPATYKKMLAWLAR